MAQFTRDLLERMELPVAGVHVVLIDLEKKDFFKGVKKVAQMVQLFTYFICKDEEFFPVSKLEIGRAHV